MPLALQIYHAMIATGKVSAEGAELLTSTVSAAKPESSPRQQKPPQDLLPRLNSPPGRAPTADEAHRFIAAADSTTRVGMPHCSGTAQLSCTPADCLVTS